MMGGAKGTPAVCCYSAVLSVCRIAGYFAGYLTWLFSRFLPLFSLTFKIFSSSAICSLFSTPCILPLSQIATYKCRHGLDPVRPTQDSPGCGARAQATGRSRGHVRFSFSRLFHFLGFSFDFLHFGHIHVSL